MTAELSGVDLARRALFAAQEAAKKTSAARKEKPKRRTGTVGRRDGREPLGLGAAIGMMMTERCMVAPAAGGSVLAQFDDILATAAPELAGRVRAVAFTADTSRRDVAPDVPACGTKLRWSAPKLIAVSNERVPPRPASPPSGRAARTGRPEHREGRRAADRRDARVESQGVPPARQGAGRRARPDRPGRRIAPPGRGDQGRCPAPARAEKAGHLAQPRAAGAHGVTADQVPLPDAVPAT